MNGSFLLSPELHLRQCIDCCRLRVTDRASVFRCYSEVIQDTTLSLVLGPQTFTRVLVIMSSQFISFQGPMITSEQRPLSMTITLHILKATDWGWVSRTVLVFKGE
jgi:hypothetical protein